MGIAGVIIWLVGILTYLLGPPDPPSRTGEFRGMGRMNSGVGSVS